MREVTVRMQRPAVRRARREHPGMLARAIVAELPLRPALLQTVLEVVDGRSRAREHLANSVELGGLRMMRRTGDRDLVVVEVVVALDERDGLDRLRRRAQEADEVGIPEGASVGHGHVYAVDGLDDVAAPHGYPDRIHRRRSLR